uniref:CUB domain-containing protein n=2 Tax=Acrobeloides nanus TaxID=290746 RepID=A0A914C9N9_9BILA
MVHLFLIVFLNIFLPVYVLDDVLATRTKACSCNPISTLILNKNNQKANFTPTLTEYYCSNTICNWKIEINYDLPQPSILYMDFNKKNIRSQDCLTITNCNYRTLFTECESVSLVSSTGYFFQENELCINFNTANIPTGYEQNSTNGAPVWSLAFTFINAPPIKPISLNSSNPAIAVHTTELFNGIGMLTVIADHGTLDMFVLVSHTDTTYPYLLYYSDQLKNFVGSLERIAIFNSSPLQPVMSTADGVLSVLYSINAAPNAFTLFFFRIREDHAAQCDDFKNIYKVRYDVIKRSALSTGPCVITLLDHRYPTIRTKLVSLSYNGSNTIKTVAGYNDDYILFEADKTLFGNYSGTVLYGTAISFIIPANDTINVVIDSTQSTSSTTFTNSIQSIMTSNQFPYPETQELIYVQNLSSICTAGNANFSLTFEYFDLSLNSTLYLVPNGANGRDLPILINQTNVNNTIKLQNKNNFLLSYTPSTDSKERGFLLRYNAVFTLNSTNTNENNHS